MRPWAHRQWLAMLLALIVVACGDSTASSSPSGASASPSGGPGASSTLPVSVDDVLAKLRDPALAFNGSLKGELKLGSLSLPISGLQQAAGSSSYSLTIVTAPTGVSRTETTKIGDKTWSRASESSPWFEEPATTTSSGFGGSLEKVSALRDLGSDVRDGKEVRRFRTPDGLLKADDLGLTSPTISDVIGFLDVYTDGQANPVAMVITATYKQTTSDGTTVDAILTADYTLSPATPTIKAPTDTWVHFTSKRYGYTIGRPSAAKAVDSTRQGEGDSFVVDAARVYVAGRDSLESRTTLAGYLKAFSDATFRDVGKRPESQTNVTVDGRPGKLLKYHFRLNGHDRFVPSVLTVDGSRGYYIVLYAPPKNEAAALSFLTTVIGTFHVTE